jgi:hypothetical protein
MITGNHGAKISWLQRQLSVQFAMSLLGPVTLYLGVDFFYSPHGVMLSHGQYIQKCLVEMGLADCLPVPIPMDPKLKLSLHMQSPLLEGPAITYYRMGVGKLLHVTNTRPDVAFSVGVVTRFTSAPREAHLDAVIMIFRYLKGSATYAIHYQRGGDIVPIGYTDSDYLGDMDERKSTSGYLMSIGSGPILWKSKLQDEVAQSSSEAEYRAVAEGAKEAMWLRNLMEEIGFPFTKPITLFVDNQSAIKMARNPVLQARTKHIEKSCHLIRDHVKKGRIQLEFIRSREQIADVLTKPISTVHFRDMRRRLHMKTREEVEGKVSFID